eukprot:195529-Chlamydomonas_euryale.AAC.2
MKGRSMPVCTNYAVLSSKRAETRISVCSGCTPWAGGRPTPAPPFLRTALAGRPRSLTSFHTGIPHGSAPYQPDSD